MFLYHSYIRSVFNRLYSSQEVNDMTEYEIGYKMGIKDAGQHLIDVESIDWFYGDILLGYNQAIDDYVREFGD